MSTHSLALAVGVLAAGFVVFCLADLVRAEKVRYLPRWAWAILCLGIGLTIPSAGSSTWSSGRIALQRHRL